MNFMQIVYKRFKESAISPWVYNGYDERFSTSFPKIWIIESIYHHDRNMRIKKRLINNDIKMIIIFEWWKWKFMNFPISQKIPFHEWTCNDRLNFEINHPIKQQFFIFRERLRRKIIDSSQRSITFLAALPTLDFFVPLTFFILFLRSFLCFLVCFCFS